MDALTLNQQAGQAPETDDGVIAKVAPPFRDVLFSLEMPYVVTFTANDDTSGRAAQVTAMARDVQSAIGVVESTIVGCRINGIDVEKITVVGVTRAQLPPVVEYPVLNI